MGAKRNRELKAEPNNSYNSQWGNWMIRRHQFDEAERRAAIGQPASAAKGIYEKTLNNSHPATSRSASNGTVER